MTPFEKWWDVQDYPDITKEAAHADWQYAMFSASNLLIDAAQSAMREVYLDQT